MRIHTSILTPGLIGEALSGRAGGKATQVSIHVISTHGSNGKWARGYEVALRGHGVRHTKHPQTSILSANDRERAATYDDWGWFVAALFVLDPDARCGPYKGASDFTSQTRGKYAL